MQSRKVAYQFIKRENILLSTKCKSSVNFSKTTLNNIIKNNLNYILNTSLIIKPLENSLKVWNRESLFKQNMKAET